MLKYLFRANYSDGTFLQQTLEDRSKTDPKKSAFYDVNQDSLDSFELTDGVNRFSVDLRDGSFVTNGMKFKVHDEQDGFGPFKLIFFRRHTHSFNIRQEEVGHVVTYLIGWSQDDGDGGEIKRVMEVV